MNDWLSYSAYADSFSHYVLMIPHNIDILQLYVYSYDEDYQDNFPFLVYSLLSFSLSDLVIYLKFLYLLLVPDFFGYMTFTTNINEDIKFSSP